MGQMRFELRLNCRYLFALVLFFPTSARCQISQAEHLSHHPELAAQSGTPTSPTQADPQSGEMGGMMGMMASMMGGPQTRELYPTLISLPELTADVRRQVESDAQARIRSAVRSLGSAFDSLVATQSASDYVGVQAALADLKEAAANYEAGITALRALSEGETPREVALAWFRQEMRLTSRFGAPHSDWPLSISPFHAMVMTILTLFSSAMLAMYFFKMRRAAALLDRLTRADTSDHSPFPDIGSGFEGGSPRVEPPPALTRFDGELAIASITVESARIKTFRLANPLGGDLPFRFLPGQFLTLTATPKGKPVKRSYTIASSPTDRSFCDLTIKREDAGLVSPYLHDVMRVGDRLRVSGPNGTFTFTGSEASSLLLIGAGVGVTPLMSVLRYLAETNWKGSVHLLFSCRNADDWIFRKELRNLATAHPNFKVTVTFTGTPPADWTGLTGRIGKEMLVTALSELTAPRIHICGPNSMMDAVKELLLELGVAQDSIKLEAFGPDKGTPLAPPGAPRIATVDASVTFTKSGKKAFIPPHLTILDAAESVGVEIESSCRAGTCGLCKVRLLHGNVTMTVQDALTETDKQQGFILACQAKTTANVIVEA